MNERLAINGGTPVRTQPFGQSHDFGDEDIAALTEVIRSGNIGKGPQVAQFEREFAARHGVKHAISVTSGTAAMHVCIGARWDQSRPRRRDYRFALDRWRQLHRCAITQLRPRIRRY